MEIDTLKRHWEAFGRDDPLWAVLTEASRTGGRWDLDEFLAEWWVGDPLEDGEGKDAHDLITNTYLDAVGSLYDAADQGDFDATCQACTDIADAIAQILEGAAEHALPGPPAAMKVEVFQCPNGTLQTSRAPRVPRP